MSYKLEQLKIQLLLYIVIQTKSEIFLSKKNIKITKRREHAFKVFASTYNVEILNSFNPELQLKDTKSASTSKYKLKKLLPELKRFEFVRTLVLVFKKIKSEDKTKFDDFYSSSKAKYI